MPRLFVNNTFQFRGKIHRAGSVLTVTETDLKSEMERGDHRRRKGHHLSGLINHCSPADDATARLMNAKEVVDPDEGAKEATISEDDTAVDPRQAAWDEMDALGVAYDKRWQKEKLSHELIKAKKVKGE